MKTILMLTKRNMKLYMRDRTAIFFSILTILIIIGLNIVFLQKMNVDELTQMASVEKEKATLLITSLTLAGIIFTSTVTVTLNVIGIMIEDEEHKRLMSFLVSPISRLQLTLGYILASFNMGCLFSFVTLALSQGYTLLIGGTLISFPVLIKLIGIIIINVFTNACMVFFFTTFIRSSSSFAALNTILGTLIGFIAGIYLPMGLLPELVQKVLKCFPGLYGASLIREVYSTNALNEVFHLAPGSIAKDYAEYMGITLSWHGSKVSSMWQLLILAGSGILFIIFSVIILNKRKGTDR